jgi:hypothetical protein
MAYAVTSRVQSVFGNKRVVTGVLECDATSGAVDTGLSVIEGISLSPKSAATASVLVKLNLNSGATALGGSLFIDNAASGDDFHFIATGR